MMGANGEKGKQTDVVDVTLLHIAVCLCLAPSLAKQKIVRDGVT